MLQQVSEEITDQREITAYGITAGNIDETGRDVCSRATSSTTNIA
jgi:hypothetical protein